MLHQAQHHLPHYHLPAPFVSSGEAPSNKGRSWSQGGGAVGTVLEKNKIPQLAGLMVIYHG